MPAYQSVKAGGLYWNVMPKISPCAQGTYKATADAVPGDLSGPSGFQLMYPNHHCQKVEPTFISVECNHRFHCQVTGLSDYPYTRFIGSAHTCALGQQSKCACASYVQGAWDAFAMGNYPYPSSYITGDPEAFLPAWPMRVACWEMTKASGVYALHAVLIPA